MPGPHADQIQSHKKMKKRKRIGPRWSIPGPHANQIQSHKKKRKRIDPPCTLTGPHANQIQNHTRKLKRKDMEFSTAFFNALAHPLADRLKSHKAKKWKKIDPQHTIPGPHAIRI
jgi:hypothetical protein